MVERKISDTELVNDLAVHEFQSFDVESRVSEQEAWESIAIVCRDERTLLLVMFAQRSDTSSHSSVHGP